jgi:PTH1 family peptidyl-tRNA hydrolase
VKCIVGLGNPGQNYEMTRHNIGFLVLDHLAERHGLSFRKSWWHPFEVAKGILAGEKVWLVKPQTFMNRSGLAVRPLLGRLKHLPDDLLVVFDDTALDWGRLRVRAQGSAGGHNGVQSVLDALGDGSFGRIRVGIGTKPDMVSLSDYVLGPFSDEEERELADVVQRAADAVETVCKEGIARAMNVLN